MEQGNNNAPNSEKKPASNSKKRRPSNRRRNSNKKKADGRPSKEVQANAGTKPGPKKKASNRNRRRRYSNKSRRPQTQNLKGEDFVIVKYLNLLEQHIMARRKYFENFDRVGEKQREKLERNFIETQKTFLAFKERLKEEDLKIFEEKFEGLKPDLTYSSNHELPAGEIEPEVKSDEIEDPHYLQTQIQSDFSEDTEESTGSLEDYKAYKGL